MVQGIREQFSGVLSRALSRGHSNAAGTSPHLPAAVNRHSAQWPLVAACLACGLHPQLVRRDARGRRVACLTKGDGKVQHHKGSVLAAPSDPARGSHRWAVYFEKVRCHAWAAHCARLHSGVIAAATPSPPSLGAQVLTVGGVTLFDASEVAPLAVALLAGLGSPPPALSADARAGGPASGDDGVGLVPCIVPPLPLSAVVGENDGGGSGGDSDDASEGGGSSSDDNEGSARDAADPSGDSPLTPSPLPSYATVAPPAALHSRGGFGSDLGDGSAATHIADACRPADAPLKRARTATAAGVAPLPARRRAALHASLAHPVTVRSAEQARLLASREGAVLDAARPLPFWGVADWVYFRVSHRLLPLHSHPR